MPKILNQTQWDLFGEEPEDELKDQPVYYSNQLARMQTKFTLEEEKVLHVIFSRVNAFDKNEAIIRINKTPLFKALGVKGNSKYLFYKNLFMRLIMKSYTEVIDDHNGDKTLGTDITQGVVIYSVNWNDSKEPVSVMINPMFMPYISQLADNYTKVSLSSVMSFKSKFSLSLYRYLCSWTDNTEELQENARYITTKDLKDLFGLSEDAYTVNGKFNRSVFEKKTIDLAIKEINTNTDIRVEYKKIKKSGNVQSYAFHFIRVKIHNL